MVIAVLAVIWVIALTPMMLRKLSERRFSNSVDSFHRQLRGMRRAYPRLAASAADPEMALSVAQMTDTSARASFGTASRVQQSESADRRSAATRATVSAPSPCPARPCRGDARVLPARVDPRFECPVGPVATGVRRHSLLLGTAHPHPPARRGARGQSRRYPGTSQQPESRCVLRTPSCSFAGSPDEIDWSANDLLGPAFGLDYDEIVAGGR